jgi:hypothetical protein
MAVMLLSALALALAVLTTIETLAAANHRGATVALYAAEAGIERVLPDLASFSNWDDALSGVVASTFVDGPPSGGRSLPDGRTVDPSGVASLAGCGLRTPCSAAALDAVTADRPWGRNNPRWQPFGYGTPALAVPRRDVYVVVLVGDDPSENDDDPLRDGRPPDNPGAGILVVRAEAFGPAGSHRIVEAVVSRAPERLPGPPGLTSLRLISWREVR